MTGLRSDAVTDDHVIAYVAGFQSGIVTALLGNIEQPTPAQRHAAETFARNQGGLILARPLETAAVREVIGTVWALTRGEEVSNHGTFEFGPES